VSISALENIIKKSKSKSLEIIYHPRYVNNENGIYNEQRKMELDILSSSAIKDLLKKNNVNLS
jgi:predicted glycoside hydrolase/deacetylase ChbG (UPF0249 family)